MNNNKNKLNNRKNKLTLNSNPKYYLNLFSFLFFSSLNFTCILKVWWLPLKWLATVMTITIHKRLKTITLYIIHNPNKCHFIMIYTSRSTSMPSSHSVCQGTKSTQGAFEGDSQTVIKGLSDGSANQSINGHIIDDILHEAAQFTRTKPRLGIRGWLYCSMCVATPAFDSITLPLRIFV